MQPSGNTLYDPRIAWTREETATNRLLDGLCRRFIQFVGFQLDKIVGDAHVRVAQTERNPHVQQDPIRTPLQGIVTKAPRPITPVRGSWKPPGPKPTQVLLNLPPSYPDDLELRTRIVIGDAVKQFPVQTETIELCRHVISELTAHICATVKSKSIEVDVVPTVVGDLLHYLLVANSDESERFRLRQEVEKSDEWQKLLRELETANGNLEDAAQSEDAEWSSNAFPFSDDYRSVQFRNKSYTLTRNQSQMAKVLHAAR